MSDDKIQVVNGKKLPDPPHQCLPIRDPYQYKIGEITLCLECKRVLVSRKGFGSIHWERPTFLTAWYYKRKYNKYVKPQK